MNELMEIILKGPELDKNAPRDPLNIRDPSHIIMHLEHVELSLPYEHWHSQREIDIEIPSIVHNWVFRKVQSVME